METEILEIIEGGLTNDRKKIVSNSERLANRLSHEGQEDLAKCIRQKIDSFVSNQAITSKCQSAVNSLHAPY